MIGELLKAIKSRWTAKALGSVFPGGISEGPSSNTTLPSVFVDVVGFSSTFRATSTTDNKIEQYGVATIDFIIHAKGGLSNASSLAEQLKAVFTNMAATLAGGVKLLSFFYQGETWADDPDHSNVKDWTVTYQATLTRSETLVNV